MIHYIFYIIPYFEKAEITKSGSIPIPEKNFKFPGIAAKNFRQEQQIIF